MLHLMKNIKKEFIFLLIKNTEKYAKVLKIVFHKQLDI